MSVELAPRNDPQETDRDTPPNVLERLVERGEMEVVTAASGTILLIHQRLDE